MITMKTVITITALVLYGFAVGVNAQGHGGGHGGGGHAAGGHGGGHAGGGHSSGGSSGGHSGGVGRSGSGSASGTHTGGTSTNSGGAVATARAEGGVRGTSGTAAARGSNTARGNRVEDGAPPYSRPRDGRDAIGTAVPRTAVAQTSSSTATILLPGIRSYPFGFYRPWVGFGFGVYGFSPYDWGYVDPWYGPPLIGPSGGFAEDCEGALRLRIKPSDARVYVDGQYVGVVDDFDGIFQKLHITCGPHHIEVTTDGYETLVFDARIMPGHKTTYQGVLTRIQ